ncbi:MAG: copper amine oxidase N-terminal domain-containing protein [Clostridia bacterium]|nr:copper amine oxidase N-terminal domain-containing protein [Clostridia bacterium]
MKRKLICTLLSVLMLSGSLTALAADDITVSVDRRTIHFEDQAPVIINDRVLVPVRGVFEALGARVLWNAEERKVTVFSKDNLSRIVLYIDSTDFKQVIFKSLLNYEVKDFTSEVAPQIINDRTMIPLYLVADYMSNEAVWNGEDRSVTVTSKEFLKLLSETAPAENMTAEETLNSSLTSISLSTDKADVQGGDEVTVRVNLSNTAVNADKKHFGTTAAVHYNRDNYTLKSCNYITNTELGASAYNPDFMGDSVKFIYLHDPATMPEFSDGTVVELVFTANNDEGGSFWLSDRITKYGSDTHITLTADTEDIILDTADKLYIDTTPVVVK